MILAHSNDTLIYGEYAVLVFVGWASPAIGLMIALLLAVRKRVRGSCLVVAAYYVCLVMLWDSPIPCILVVGGPVVALIAVYLAILTGASERCASAGAHSYCSNCGYDLTGNVSGVCPECGRVLKVPNEREARN